MDVCAIPVTSIPCERLFSAGGEITTDRRSCLGSERFEQLQVLRHAWRGRTMDWVALNLAVVEEVNGMVDFQELLQEDEESMQVDDDVV
jgi:hypothetical protein